MTNPIYDSLIAAQYRSYGLIFFNIIVIVLASIDVAIHIVGDKVNLWHIIISTIIIVTFFSLTFRRIYLMCVDFWLTAWEARGLVDKLS
jgi:hypothetical protein